MHSFKEYLNEHILSIGVNPDHEKYREAHRSEFHDILKNSYKEIGGYGSLGHGTKEESDAIHHDITHSMIKASKRNGKITSVNLYKKQHGRKSIASGTDGSAQGKMDFKQNKKEDIGQQRSWGEVSGAPEAIAHKMGAPKVKSKHVEKLLGKKITAHDDGYHYDREISGHKHTKVVVGYPKFDK